MGIKFEKGKNGLFDWSPFVLLFVVYNSINTVFEDQRWVYIKEVYDAEMILFGWLFDGQIPSFWFEQHQSDIVSIIASVSYSMHFIIPVTAAIMIGYVTKDKENFLRLRISFFCTVAVGLATYIIFPVAPPWYVAQQGFAQPTSHHRTPESAAGLLVFDRLFGIDLFGRVYGAYNATPYGAMPSLHSAFSLLSAILLVATYRERSRWIYLVYLYPISIWFSAVYLQHHYILDVLAGIALVLIVNFLTVHLLQPNVEGLEMNLPTQSLVSGD